MHEKGRTTFMVPADDYRRIIEQVDETRIQEAFVGTWPSRDDFGQHLLQDSRAEARLSALPHWLKPYVRLDGAALVRDLEADGLYVVAEVSSGVYVFDGPVVHNSR